MKNILMVLMFFLSFNAFSTEQIGDEKKRLIEKLLEQSGQTGLAVGKQFSDVFIQQMTVVLKRSNPDIPPEVLNIMEEEIISGINEEMVLNNAFIEKLYPIYDRHFNEQELREMIAFNSTDLGKKILKVTPIITKEGMQVGQEFGKTLGPKIQQRIKDRFKKEGIH